MTTNYTTLSLADVAADLSAIAREAQSVFGRLDERQLNWRADAARWSVAQCFDHLLNANREMFQEIDAAMDGSRPGRCGSGYRCCRASSGGSWSLRKNRRRHGSSRRRPQIVPASSAIDPGIVERFVAGQHEAAARIRSLDPGAAARTIMVSPFVPFITYSVLDGCRLMVTHERRHFEQARRVTLEPGFPSRVAGRQQAAGDAMGLLLRSDHRPVADGDVTRGRRAAVRRAGRAAAAPAAAAAALRRRALAVRHHHRRAGVG